MPEFENTKNKSDEYKNGAEYRLPIAELYPGLTPDEQAEAEYFLTRYLEVVNRIFEEKYGLTSSNLNATVSSSE